MKLAQAYVEQDVFTRLSQPHPVESQVAESGFQGESRGTFGADLSSISGVSTDGRALSTSFCDFLDRQRTFAEQRQRHLADLEAVHAPPLRPALALHSRRLVEQQRESQQRTRSGSPAAGEASTPRAAARRYRAGSADAATTRTTMQQQSLLRRSGSSTSECSFRPEITLQAARQPPRSPLARSTGDYLRRELHVALLAEAQREEEESQAPFAPQLLRRPSRGCLRLREAPEEYLARVREAQEASTLRCELEAARREEESMLECTFRPEVKPSAPAFVRQMAARYAAVRRAREEAAKKAEEAARGELEASGDGGGSLAGRPEWIA